MRLYSLLASAKINLYLEIIGDRPDGFHELVMVMQSVDLADRVTVRSLGTKEIRVSCSHPQVPNDKTNLAYRAAALMAEKFPDAYAKQGGVDITIEKQIPVGAGLAGGSTNAAAVLVGVDLLWNLGLTQLELQDLGAKLGSDVPFCVVGGTAIATGRGEELDFLYGLDNLYVLLAKYRSLSVSTPWAYKSYRQQFGDAYISISDSAGLDERRRRVHSGPMVAAIAHQNGLEIGQGLHNDLEKVVLSDYPKVAYLKKTMAALGGLGSMMSGSGPTVFSLVSSRQQAEQMKTQTLEQISDPDLDLWVAKFLPTGIRLDD
ncbi:MAG: 4-(cytidine 5'-diphospho)-2-C-methyl-D-erythritol kinase [Leptolyngbyaceae cyanobacterium MO_188.B28]|nr:4-(cytidine 5'-diphospho)-2-C-methyl-D-erythritol kinase [Leptolyngbyaceae cyanobacterium MO_188.B28]